MARDEVNLAAVAEEAIVSQRKHLRELTASRHPRSRKYGTPEMASAADVDSASRALAGLIKEARSITKDGLRWQKSLSVEEKRQAIVDWFAALPSEQQRLLIQELVRAHNEERAAS
jgi:hypothetical protein